MEKIKKEKSREENDNKENKKFKKMKSVNWESNIHFEKLKIEEEIKISKENPKDFIEIEVINQDGKVIKAEFREEHVLYSIVEYFEEIVPFFQDEDVRSYRYRRCQSRFRLYRKSS